MKYREDEIEDERLPFNREKVKKSNIGPDLEKKLSKIFPPNATIEDKFKNLDLNILTNENGEAITLFIGKRKENGKIAGEVYYRKIKNRVNNIITESHWDNQGKVVGNL